LVEGGGGLGLRAKVVDPYGRRTGFCGDSGDGGGGGGGGRWMVFVGMNLEGIRIR
jgi:hypothetical protein